MIRRLRMACVGLGISMLPACTGTNQVSDPYYTGGAPGIVLIDRPGVPPGLYQRTNADRSGGNVKVGAPVADQKFGPVLPSDNQQANARQPQVITIEGPAAIVPQTMEKRADFDGPAAVESPLSDPRRRPKLVVEPMESPGEIAGPPDLIAPKWPNPGGFADEKAPLRSPHLLPAFDSPPVHANLLPPPVVPLPGRPQPMATGTSQKVAEPVAAMVATLPTSDPAADETTLVRALKAFQSNRPEEAVNLLRRLDPTNQEVILYLMPLMVRLGEGNLNAMAPDELAMLVDRLQTATGMLKSKASLRIDRAIFCRGVRKFADVDPYEPRHEFRPGDMVFLYAELKNFTCEPILTAMGTGAGRQDKGFNIRLGASLELRDARNSLVWRTDLSKNDFAQTPPQDYYHTYRFCVPEKLPPGTYTLWLTVIDKPTNRAIRKPIEMRVGQGQ